MAAGLTKTALTRLVAEKLELTNKQAAAFFDLQAEIAIKETKKNGVFVIPGIGRLTIEAVTQRDYPVIQGVILIASFVYVLINLAIDVAYAVLDPRIRY